jgi:hypothetical protein
MSFDGRTRVSTLSAQSNEILPYEDRSLVRELLPDTQRDLDNHDAEIVQAQAHLNDLVNRCKQRTERMSRLRVGTTPQKRMPPEVLAEILMYCLDGNPVDIPPRSLPFSVPWVLGQVCSRWRMIALGEHRLWRSTHFMPAAEISESALHEVFARSGNLDVQLDINQAKSAPNLFPIILHYRK